MDLKAHPQRIVFLDYLRAFACLTVIIVHSAEFFYIGSDSPLTIAPGDNLWVSLLDSPFRAAVPLFIMASSYLLVPLPYDTPTFFRRRFKRVVIPFVIWLILYAVVPQYGNAWDGEAACNNLLGICFNFPPAAGHLWFVYMLLGVYLLMPIISPWIKSLSKRGEETFLAVWTLTTLVPYLRLLTNDGYLYGEALWNEFSLFWYVSGYIGYVVLAHYIRTYIDWSWRKTLAVSIPLFLAGYALTAGWFYGYAASIAPSDNGAILGNTLQLGEIEIGWRFCTINVAMMSFAIFIVFRKITCGTGTFYRVISDISRVSYGMYLMHIFILTAVFKLASGYFPSTPACILGVGIITYVITYLAAKLLSYIPGSKYLLG